MVRRSLVVMLSIGMVAHSAWAISYEELKERQQQLLEEAMQKEAAIQQTMSSAAAALRQNDYKQTISLVSGLLNDYQLEAKERAQALTLRAVAYFQQGDSSRALVDANDAIRQDKQQANAYKIRSLIHAKELRKDQAIADLETYVGYVPNDQDAVATLQRLKGGAGEPPPSPASAPPPSPPPGPKPMPPALATTAPAPSTAAPPVSPAKLIAPIAGTWRTNATVGGAQVDAIAMLDPNGNFNRFERWNFGLTVQIWGTYSVSPMSATQLHMSQTPTGWDPKEWCVGGARCTPLNYPVSASQFTFIDADTIRDETTQAIYKRQ